MKTKKVALIGGPGTGKSTVITELERTGYTCFQEVSREVTLEAQKKGIEQLFLTKPLLFSEMLMHGRIKHYNQAEALDVDIAFYDRGLPDITAYMDYLKTSYPSEFTQANENHRYDHVFLFPLWEEIYKQDNERYESFEEAKIIQQYLIDAYIALGYKLVVVPKASVQERAQFILQYFNRS